MSTEAREDPRITKTRESLVAALFDLVAASSWDRVTVAALCRRARVHRATFYAHFEDKSDLLTRSLPTFFDGLTGEGAWMTFFVHCQKNSAFYRRALVTPELRTLLGDYLRSHAQGYGARPGVVLDFVCAGILGVIETFVADPRDPESTARSLTEVLIRAERHP